MAEIERLEKERDALKVEVAMLRGAREEAALLDFVGALHPPQATAADKRVLPAPVCKCGAPADPTFYSPVSGHRCTNCAYRMVGKVPPGERFYRSQCVSPEPMSWPRAIGIALLIVGMPVALGAAIVANHAEIAHFANLLWGLVP